jgi:NADPH:quinone reductase-like Zn-dependent oxidoreductase
MQAILLRDFGSADNFILAGLPLPPVKPGEVRIRVTAVGFNPVDYQIRKGGPERRNLHSMVLGRDLAGVVDAVHPDVSGLKVGEEVYSYVCTLASSGTYAQFVSVPAELVAKKPASLSHEQAAAVPVAAITASMALKKAGVAAGKSVFVAGGAGGVGTFAIRLAQLAGAVRIVTTAGSEQSRAYLIGQCGLNGADVLDYRTGDVAEAAISRTGGGFDCVLDLVGGRMLAACCRMLAVDGNLVSITEVPHADDMEFLFQKNASFHPIGANAYSLVTDRSVWGNYRDMLNRLTALFDSGALAPPPVRVLGEMSVEVVREAHVLLEQGSVQGKLAMKVAKPA